MITNISSSATPPNSALQTSTAIEIQHCGICLEGIEPSSSNALNFCSNGDHALHDACMTDYLQSCQEQNPLHTMPSCLLCGSKGQMTEGQTIEISDSKETQLAKLRFAQNLNAWSHRLFIGNNTMAILELENLEPTQTKAGMQFIQASLKKVSTLPQEQQSIQLEQILSSGIERVLRESTDQNRQEDLDGSELGERIATISQASAKAHGERLESAITSLSQGGALQEERRHQINRQITLTNNCKLQVPSKSVSMENEILRFQAQTDV